MLDKNSVFFNPISPSILKPKNKIKIKRGPPQISIPCTNSIYSKFGSEFGFMVEITRIDFTKNIDVWSLPDKIDFSSNPQFDYK